MNNSIESVLMKKFPPTHDKVAYHFKGPHESGILVMNPNGRYATDRGRDEGQWSIENGVMILRPDSGGGLHLEPFAHGFRSEKWLLAESRAEFASFWPTFDPTNPIYSPLLNLPGVVTSTWRGVPDADLVVSGENARVEITDRGIVWNHGGRRGRARWFVGTPWVDHPGALHVPHLYDYWGRLGNSRPLVRRPARGISWVASNPSGPGDLNERRLAVAQGLARWFPLAVPSALKGAFEGMGNVSVHNVPWTLLGKYDFISNYSFNLCFENSRAQGYLTEKPFDALIAGAVPIYEGDPGVGEWIDSDGLIDCSGLTIDEIADRIRDAERDGTTERVWEQRENLMKVNLDEMVSRMEEFVAGIRKEMPGGRSVAKHAKEKSDLHDSGKIQAPALSRVTIVIKTILRPEALRATVASFLAALGDSVPILVVDDSPEPDGSDLPPQIRFIPLPYDSGLSMGRNQGVAAVETEFTFLADDDNILKSTPEEIQRCIELLDDGWDLIGNGAFDFKMRDGGLTVARRLMRSVVTRCDATENFFIARTAMLQRLPWDEDMKLHPEHEDFFLRLKSEGVRVGGTELLKFENLATRPFAYDALRARSFMSIFRERWGLDRISWNKNVPADDGALWFEDGEICRGRICLGSAPLGGWLNIGSPAGSGWNLSCNLKQPLPLKSACLDFISMDRVLERMSYPDGVRLLKELCRVLKPDGRIRIATFDLAFVMKLGSGKITPEEEEYVKWSTDRFLPEIPVYDPAFVANHLMRGFGHHFLYDESLLAGTLEALGFADPVTWETGRSDLMDLCGIEAPRNIPPRFHQMETLILEMRRS